MPEDNKPSQPAQPPAQQKPAEPPPKPAEPQNIFFKGSQEPQETALQKVEKSSENKKR